jgi:hypothetical protein
MSSGTRVVITTRRNEAGGSGNQESLLALATYSSREQVSCQRRRAGRVQPVIDVMSEVGPAARRVARNVAPWPLVDDGRVQRQVHSSFEGAPPEHARSVTP